MSNELTEQQRDRELLRQARERESEQLKLDCAWWAYNRETMRCNEALAYRLARRKEALAAGIPEEKLISDSFRLEIKHLLPEDLSS